MPIPLVDSPLLFDVPAVIEENSLVVTPASYASWAACRAANPTVLDFRLRKGDYVPWGPFLADEEAGGTEERYFTIRYEDTDDDLHPVQRSAENQAYVDAVKCTGAASSYYIFQGLWINDASINCGSVSEAHHNVFDYCVIEECSVYGLRMLATQYTYLQRLVVRNIVALATPGDSVGVQYKNIDEINDFDTIHNYLLDCEVINCGDGLAHTEATTKYQSVATTCDGTEFYLDSSEYIGDTNTTWRENAIDLKCGSDDHVTTISNWRAWGYRRNAAPTALGEIIVVQKYARNLEFTDGIGSDSPRGMKDENWPTDQFGFTADHTTNTLNDVGHGLNTGAGPLTLSVSGGSLPTGFAVSTPYWAIRIDDDSFRLASSRANALAETAIDFTTNGSGTLRWRSQTGASRSTAFRRNQWCRIRDYASEDAGAVYKAITDITFENEVIADSTYANDISPTTYYNPTFTGITLRDVGALQRPEDQTPALPWDPELNTVVPAPVYPVVYDTYQRKRWTGPEWAVCATVVTDEAPQPTVTVRTRLFVTPSPRRQAVRYGASRRSGRR